MSLMNAIGRLFLSLRSLHLLEMNKSSLGGSINSNRHRSSRNSTSFLFHFYLKSSIRKTIESFGGAGSPASLRAEEAGKEGGREGGRERGREVERGGVAADPPANSLGTRRRNHAGDISVPMGRRRKPALPNQSISLAHSLRLSVRLSFPVPIDLSRGDMQMRRWAGAAKVPTGSRRPATEPYSSTFLFFSPRLPRGKIQ